MKILVINAGSSSLKFQLFDMDETKVMVKGICDRIGFDNSVMEYRVPGKDKYVVNQNLKTHKEAMALVLKTLVDKDHGVI